MIGTLLLAALTATFAPARPTVGDRIAIEFPQPVKLDPSKQFEIVSQQGNRVVIRTFEPQPLVLGGTAGNVRFDNLILPVHSVLRGGDDLQPAPLLPPRPDGHPRLPFVAIGLAALAAAASWGAAMAMSRRTRVTPLVGVPPAEQFRREVLALRDGGGSFRWAALADATRRYLAARGFGTDLTTTQTLARVSSANLIAGAADLIAQILRHGDLEKFSPWGAPPADFHEVATWALGLPDSFEPAVAEEERAA